MLKIYLLLFTLSTYKLGVRIAEPQKVFSFFFIAAMTVSNDQNTSDLYCHFRIKKPQGTPEENKAVGLWNNLIPEIKNRESPVAGK